MEELFKARKEKLNLFKSIRNKMQDKKRIDVPDGLYTKCDSCGESILSEDLKESYYVCPKCGAHLKMRAYTRLNLLYDGGKYKELYKSIKSNDPLMFPGYKEKLVKLEETTNLDEAVVLRKINIVADLLQKLALFEKFIVQCKNILKNI